MCCWAARRSFTLVSVDIGDRSALAHFQSGSPDSCCASAQSLWTFLPCRDQGWPYPEAENDPGREHKQCHVPSRSDFSKLPDFLAVPRLSRRLWNFATTTTLLFHCTFLAAQMKPHLRVTLTRITESSVTGQLWKRAYTLPSPVGSTVGSWRAFLISKSWAIPRSAVCGMLPGLGQHEDCGTGLWWLGGLAKLAPSHCSEIKAGPRVWNQNQQNQVERRSWFLSELCNILSPITSHFRMSALPLFLAYFTSLERPGAIWRPKRMILSEWNAFIHLKWLCTNNPSQRNSTWSTVSSVWKKGKC